MSSPDNGSSEPQGRAALGADLIIPLLACGLTFYYLLSTTELVWEARATGTVIGLTLLVLCVALFVRFGRQFLSGRADFGFGDLFVDNRFNRQRIGLIVMVAFYVATIQWVGATVGLFFLLIGCMWLLGVRRLRTNVAVALAAAVFVHLTLITLLDGKLPRGMIIDQFSPVPQSAPPASKKK